MKRTSSLFLLAALLSPLPAIAQSDALDSQKLKLEQLRAEVADQVQFQAFDLLDELMLAWKEQPVFPIDTPVVLADVSVPVGFGTGLTAMIENHFFDVLLKNPGTHLVPAQCPACTAMVVHSGAKGTLIARGVDNPEALANAGLLSGARHALFLDFEIEGSALVLRARITALTPALPIVAARTLSSSTSAAPMLRASEHLKTAEEARAEYLEALNSRGIVLLPIRFKVQIFATPSGGQVSTVPLIWAQTGAEVALTRSRGWTASLLAGINWAPQSSTGWSLHARFSRLLGVSSSLTGPDVYFFFGAGMFALYGTGALAFKNSVPTVDDLTNALNGHEPSAIVGTGQLGLEIRIKNRIGGSFYLESAPGLDNAPAIGNLLDLGIIRFHSYGMEVSFWF